MIGIKTFKFTRTQPKQRETIHFEKLLEGIYSFNYRKDIRTCKYNKEQIQGYIDTKNIDMLRAVSNYFYLASGEYRRLIDYFGNLLTCDNYIVPRKQTLSKTDQKNFNDAFAKVLDYMDISNSKVVNRFIITTVLKEGTCYLYERELDGIIGYQQLPPNYCRSRFKILNSYAVEFNLKFFDTFKTTEEKIEMFKLFPDELLDAYNQYKTAKTHKMGDEWFLLNPEFARCHKLEDDGLPIFSPVFAELLTLNEYKAMDKTQSELELYKLVIQKLPFDKEKGLMINETEAKDLHVSGRKMIDQQGVDLFTTPCEVTTVNLQQSGATLRDNIDKATISLYNSTGTSYSIFGSKDAGAIALEKSVLIDGALLFPLLDQFKTWYENKINLFLVPSRNYNFTISFLQTTIFNWKDFYDVYKELATLGYSKLLPAIASGIPQSDLINMLNMEKDIYDMESLLIPLQSSYQNGDNANGRPSQGNKITDTTAKQKDKGTNKDRGLVK